MSKFKNSKKDEDNLGEVTDVRQDRERDNNARLMSEERNSPGSIGGESTVSCHDPHDNIPHINEYNTVTQSCNNHDLQDNGFSLSRDLIECRYKLALAELAVKQAGISPSEVPDPFSVHKVNKSVVALDRSSNLPRVDLEPFDGNPKNYIQFVHQFEYYIESVESDPHQRLTHLIHHCKGIAKEAIKHYVVFPPPEGYQRARSTLRSLFGGSNLVARATIDDLLRGVKLSIDDSRSLTWFAIKMRNCSITLSKEHQNELNAHQTLEAIVKILPIQWRQDWAQRADTLLQCEVEVSFDHLCDFVESRARIARSRYGQLIVPESRMGRQFSSNHLTTVSPCVVCNGSHYLEKCERFLSMSRDDRFKIVKEKNLCFACLRTGHGIGKCQSLSKCSKGCNSKFHPILHEHKVEGGQLSINACSTDHIHSSTVLNTVPVCVWGPNGCFETYALLDNGSEATVMQRDVLERVGIPCRKSSVSLTTISGSAKMPVMQATVSISPIMDATKININKVLVVDRLNLKPFFNPAQNIPKICHSSHVRLYNLSDPTVRIIIGADVIEAHWVLEQCRLTESLIATRNAFGWCVSGTVNPRRIEKEKRCNYTSVEFLLRRLYDQEFGDVDSDRAAWSLEDKRAVSLVEKSTRMVGQRYEVPLPWRGNPQGLPNNYPLAMQRLNGLLRRFARNEGFKAMYVAEMNKSIERGHIVRVPSDQLTTDHPIRWYLPHHAVTSASKPGKLRIVYDCAARYEGRALNDALLQGPDLINGLIGVLTRFRMGPIALMADIEAMFMQVMVPVDDRAALRLLWFDNPELTGHPVEFQMAAHPFGAISSPFCASYALRRLAMDFREEFPNQILEAIENNFYVDDCLIAFSDVAEAKLFIQNICKLTLKGGFKLVKWVSNVQDVYEVLPENLRSASTNEGASPQLVSIQPYGEKLYSEGQSVKALGIRWDTAEDCFCMRFDFSPRPDTKRSLLSAIASFYDPLGLVTPLMLPAKLILQDLCRAKLAWDEPIPERSRLEISKWLKCIENLGEVRVPRHIDARDKGCQVHVFSDASQTGYGAVVYLYCPGEGNQCHLVLAKSRVAPLKAVTIPRLELGAAVLGIKLVDMLIETRVFEGLPIYYWTDSQIVLYYIQNRTSRFSTFVANRLAFIHDRSEPGQWQHVRSECNPADPLSRGITSLRQYEKWRAGPRSLISGERAITVAQPDLSSVEFKKCAVLTTSVERDRLEDRFSRISSWIRTLKYVAWWRRYFKCLQMKIQGAQNRRLGIGPITIREMDAAEMVLIKLVQRPWISKMNSHDHLGSSAPITVKIVEIRKLNPVMTEGIIRVGGRIAPQLTNRCPILLPKESWMSVQLVKYYHKLEGHCGPAHLLSYLREKYWIIKGLQLVKRTLNECWTCRRGLALPQAQIMAPLADFRFTAGRYPFAYVGVDYFGPFQVHKLRKREKRYVCLFTCLQIRAVHLELVESLSADSLILAVMRFIARRGIPKRFFSDNGTNMVGAVNELRRELRRTDHTHIRDRMSSRRIDWSFNPPYSSHRGGLWERMIRSVRRILWATLPRDGLKEECLLSVIVEAEGILNNRPIVPLQQDSVDQIALTPNHLLLLRSSELTVVPESVSDLYRRQWQLANKLADTFWRKWIQDYVPTLQSRQKWNTRCMDLKRGDVVMMVEQNSPRNEWPLGIVVGSGPSRDGAVRTVQIRTRNGEVCRDVRKLCLIEAYCAEPRQPEFDERTSGID